MKKNKSPYSVRTSVVFSLVLSLCLGIVIADTNFGRRVAASPAGKPKQAKGTKKISPDLEGKNASAARARVILQLDGKPSGQLNALLKRNGVHVKGLFRNFNAQVIELPENLVEELAAFPEVTYVSVDRETQPFGHVSHTSGADATRLQGSLLGGSYILDGSGIGIAVLDSGIDQNHKAFLGHLGNSRIVANVDFTGEGRIDDQYGHGTHVAAIAAGNGRIANAKYIGIAPNANIVNLRVLNAQGTGTVSSVLSALDWLMTNRTAYNVRVVNMSLGMPAVDSYKDDPVCKAVRRLADVGVVVVAAAGNNGKDSAGRKIYGSINSPGNEPSALTVGATNTYGTNARNDDGIASFSSRGPTRSYSTDADGVRHHDNLIKPDIVAPGNKIVSAQAADNHLVRTHPELDAGVSGNGTRRHMYLNGTSMAAPIATGGAALLLQANPQLTPNMVKAILMYTAQPLAGYNMFEQGAGQLNVEGAIRLAKLFRTDLTALTPVGAPLLTSLTLPNPKTTIAGYQFNWAQGLILNKTYAKGTNLITQYQKIYALGVVIGDGVIIGTGVTIGDNGGVIGTGVVIGDDTMLSLGVTIGDNIMTSSGVVIGDGTIFCGVNSLFDGVVIGTGVVIGDSGGVIGTGVVIGDGLVLRDGVVIGAGVIIGNGVLMNDFMLQAQSAALAGESTPSMEIEVDTGVDYEGYE